VNATYLAHANDIRAAWKYTDQPDPVFRFIPEPSKASIKSALLWVQSNLKEQREAEATFAEISTTQQQPEPTPMPSKPQFDVFLCHNSKDKPMVRQLGEALKKRGLRVWLDEWELVPGRPWQEALEEIVQTTNAATVLVGNDGIGPWQDRELRGCLSEFVERGLPVIPVLLPDAPTKPALPFFLKQFTWVDLRGGLTNEGLETLVWGITGVKPNP
jgi:nucleotide-binding universal stress UspA family protein